MTDDNKQAELKGVAGWLAFLVTVLGLVSPTNKMLDLFNNLGLPWDYDWEPVLTMTWLLNLAAIFFSVYLAYRLFVGRDWQTVRFVIAGVWVISVGTTIAIWAIAYLIAPDELNDEMGVFMGELLRGVVFGTVWTLYLLNSKRVRNTYSDSGHDGIAQTFS